MSMTEGKLFFVIIILICITKYSMSQDFSVEAIVPNDYFIKDLSGGNSSSVQLHNYCKKKFDAIMDTLQNYRNQDLKFDIPKKIADKYIKSMEGDSVLQICEGKIIGKDTIIGYESIMDGNGGIEYFFKLKHLQNKHDNMYKLPNYFYIINPESNISINYLEEKETDIQTLDMFWSYMKKIFEDEKDLIPYDYYYNLTKSFNRVSVDSIKRNPMKYLNYRIYETQIDEDGLTDYILVVQGKHKMGIGGWTFCDFIFSESGSNVFCPLCKLEYCIGIGESKYFLLTYRKYDKQIITYINDEKNIKKYIIKGPYFD
jgi:hypothetical protein